MEYNKNKKIEENIKKFREQQTEEFNNRQKMLREEKFNKLNECASSLNNTISKEFERKRKLQEDRECYDIVVNQLLTETLTSIFYESLMLDDEVKLENSTRLIEFGTSVYTKLFESGIINEDSFANSNSLTIRNIHELCSEAAQSIIASDKSASKASEILTRAGAAIDAKAKHIDEIVKDKVVSVIRNEREIAERNQEKLDSLKSDIEKNKFMRKEQPTIMRSLIIGAVKHSKSDEINTEKALAEGIINYTLLETLNTTRVLEMTPKEWDSFAKAFRVL